MTIRNLLRRSAGLLTILLVIFPACGTGTGEAGLSRPRNIILMIGDGMGLSQITAARVVEGGLNIDRMGTVGLQSTSPATGLVTDSAASGTAIATGHKTLNGAISVDPGGAVLKTVLEYAEEIGMMSGLVSTSSITHATPAVFAAHVTDRDMCEEIAWQIAGSGVDLLMGGGFAYFLHSSEEGSAREDELDPLAVLSERMTILRPGESPAALQDTRPLAVFTAMEHPPPVQDREMSLSEMTDQALHVLSAGANGFFLMVEGAQIDWVAHDNDLDGLILEMRDFDGAVGAALEFAATDGNTLVIVTGDHETGGFAIHEGSAKDRTITEAGWTSGSHTATMLPVFAQGPGEGLFAGVYENTEIGNILISIVSNNTH